MNMYEVLSLMILACTFTLAMIDVICNIHKKK